MAIESISDNAMRDLHAMKTIMDLAKCTDPEALKEYIAIFDNCIKEHCKTDSTCAAVLLNILINEDFDEFISCLVNIRMLKTRLKELEESKND